MSVETSPPRVLVVDDEPNIVEVITMALRYQGFEAASAATGQEALAAIESFRPQVMILEVMLPDMEGFEVAERLGAERGQVPIIFLSGHGDIAMTVQAMKAGAVDFLTKPVRDKTLLDAVTAAIEKDISLRTAARHIKQHVDRYAKLTPREREVLREVAKGRLNKQIAFDLGISEITVKLHRGNVTRKMQATSVGQLIRIWELLPAEIREKKAS